MVLLHFFSMVSHAAFTGLYSALREDNAVHFCCSDVSVLPGSAPWGPGAELLLFHLLCTPWVLSKCNWTIWGLTETHFTVVPLHSNSDHPPSPSFLARPIFLHVDLQAYLPNPSRTRILPREFPATASLQSSLLLAFTKLWPDAGTPSLLRSSRKCSCP